MDQAKDDLILKWKNIDLETEVWKVKKQNNRKHKTDTIFEAPFEYWYIQTGQWVLQWSANGTPYISQGQKPSIHSEAGTGGTIGTNVPKSHVSVDPMLDFLCWAGF